MPRFTKRCVWFANLNEMNRYFENLHGQVFGNVKILSHSCSGQAMGRKVELQFRVQHLGLPHDVIGWTGHWLTYRGPCGYPMNYNCRFNCRFLPFRVIIGFGLVGQRYYDSQLRVGDMVSRIYDKLTFQHRVSWLMGLKSPLSSVYRAYGDPLCDWNVIPREIFKFLRV